MKLRKGNRVRINCPSSSFDGHLATVTSVSNVYRSCWVKLYSDKYFSPMMYKLDEVVRIKL